MNDKFEILKQIYLNPLTGLQSAKKLYSKAKHIEKSLTLDEVREFLKTQPTHQINQQVKKPKTYDTIQSPAIKNNYQMDIFINPDPTLNKNYKYLLTCIDIYSRYAMVKPLRTKDGLTVFNAIKEIFDENGKPKNINTDKGSEFIYTPFVNYCKDNNITIWFSNPEQDNKNAIIERFHRTLRNLINNYTVTFNKPYIDVLPDLIQNYNNTLHTTTKSTPYNIWKNEGVNKQKVNIGDFDAFKVGDRVRHLVKKNVFSKNSSSTTYTRKIFEITKIIKNSYFLDDNIKPYRRHELVIAVENNDANNEYDDAVEEAKRQERIKRRLKKVGIGYDGRS